MASPTRTSTEAYNLQAEIAYAAVAEATRIQGRGPQAVARSVAAYQAIAVQAGATAVATQLAEQGTSAPVVAGVAATALAGLTSAGAPMAAVLPSVENLSRFVATMIQDAGRTGSSLAIVARPTLTGYTRMLGPDSEHPCSRCIILAGIVYAWDAAFERHPLCKCIQIPASEDVPGDPATDPRARFDSMTEDEQNATFTKAGAQAIRDGADMNQIVNARRSVYRAQEFGRQFTATREGVTRYGVFGQANAKRGETGKPKLPYRLMPESIYDLAAGDRDEALRLLKLYGFLI